MPLPSYTRKKDILLLGCQSSPVWCIQCYRIRLTKEHPRVPDAEKSSFPVPNSALSRRGDGLWCPNLCCSTKYVSGNARPAAGGTQSACARAGFSATHRDPEGE